MWRGQEISNQPPKDWAGPVFRLSDRFPPAPVDDSGAQPWRDAKYDALFSKETPQDRRTELARNYIWEVMRYIQEGNIDSGDVATDWNVCENRVRNWYHMPFQTYDVLSGREFVHGLTREAPVEFSLKAVNDPKTGDILKTTVWAVAFFNPTAAHTIGKVWKADGTASVPAAGVVFDEGAVVGKLLFNTASPEQLPVLQNMPTWTANISDPAFCNCETKPPAPPCTMVDQSEQCSRSTSKWPAVHLLQFDVSVKDHRAAETGWVFGTFVADGEHAAGEPNPWNRIAPLGLMWGNDPPAAGELAIQSPPDPRTRGFAQEIIFWDVVDRLNVGSGSVATKWPGHLGCNSRLNGPADNINSSCMSCHMTASVPDAKLATPPIVAQFAKFSPLGPITSQCVQPSPSDPSTGTDASGDPASAVDGILFDQMDALYFANVRCGTPFSAIATTASGPWNVLRGEPQYADGGKTWVPLDYSLQLSISLVQWGQWQAHVQHDAAHAATGLEGPNPVERKHHATLPGR